MNGISVLENFSLLALGFPNVSIWHISKTSQGSYTNWQKNSVDLLVYCTGTGPEFFWASNSPLWWEQVWNVCSPWNCSWLKKKRAIIPFEMENTAFVVWFVCHCSHSAGFVFVFPHPTGNLICFRMRGTSSAVVNIFPEDINSITTCVLKTDHDW